METPKRTSPSANCSCHPSVTLQISIPCKTPVSRKSRDEWATQSVVQKTGGCHDPRLGTGACALVFVDEHHRSIASIAGFADLNGFIIADTGGGGDGTAARHAHAGRCAFDGR